MNCIIIIIIIIIIIFFIIKGSRNSSVYIATPGGGRASTHFQTGTGAHPAYYAVGSGSFQGLKRPGRVFDCPPHLEPRLRKEKGYTTALPLGLHGFF